MEYVVAGGAIVLIGVVARTLWKEFGGYVRDVSPDNFCEKEGDRHDKERT